MAAEQLSVLLQDLSMRILKAILFVFLYLIGSLGMTFCMHICEGRIVDIAVNSPEDTHNNCCTEQEKSEKDCCQEIKILAKADPAHHFSIKDLLPAYSALLSPSIEPYYLYPISVESLVSTVGLAQPPPGNWQEIPLYLLYQNRKTDC